MQVEYWTRPGESVSSPLDVEFLLQRTLAQEQQVVRLASVRNRFHVLASEAIADDQHRRVAVAITNVCFAAPFKVRNHLLARECPTLVGLIDPAEPRDAFMRVIMIAALLVDAVDPHHMGKKINRAPARLPLPRNLRIR